MIGDVRQQLAELKDGCINTCVTSPPYWGQRDYGIQSQIGLEATPYEYVETIAPVFREVKRVLRDDGSLWLNLGDSYTTGSSGGAGAVTADGTVLWAKQKSNRGPIARKAYTDNVLKTKELIGIPWRVALRLQADGWYLRSDIIWHKSNPMPKPVKDRPTKTHEYVFLLTKQPAYFYSFDDVCQSNAGKNTRSVWTTIANDFKGAHFATFPEELPTRCILAGCPVGGVVLDPFTGSGTTAVASLKLGRFFVGVELNPEYAQLAEKRIEAA